MPLNVSGGQGTRPLHPISITGATGFVGQRTLALAESPLRALTRSPQAPRDGVTWITGDLANPGPLCENAAAVIHIAGVVSAPDRAGFDAGNVAGTAAILAAAQAAGVKRFVHVSSLAAREPGLSMYGASKSAAEALVQASGLDWIIVRPPGVYGPGDREMLDIYRLASRGFAVGPPGRLSLLHVDDLAAALLALAAGGPSHAILEIDDGKPGGYTHGEFARAIGSGLGKHLTVIPLPVSMLKLGAITGVSSKLTRDRAAYIAHPDWVARGGNAALAGLWSPQYDITRGIADTIASYRAQGWLQPSR